MPNHSIKAESGSYSVEGQSNKLIYSVRKRLVRRNWPLFSAYITVTAGGIAGSYFVEKWDAVALALVVAAITFVVGLKMLTEVDAIVREVR